jgi:alpha-beta hydrolase superfamily lysophospholipase
MQPILLIPGLTATPRFYEPVVPALWRFGPVTVANHTRDDSMAAIIGRPRPSLAAIRCPTLVLVGEQDAVTPPERAQEMVRWLDD